MAESLSFIDKIIEKASQNAVLMRAKYLSLVKRQIKSSESKNCVMNVKCSCEENNFNVLVSEEDVSRVYDRFAKKCINCGQPIKITFKF